MMYFAKLAAIGATALPVLLALIGCESDADKIREVNESLRSPTPTTSLPTTSPKQTEIRQVITRTETPTGAVREPTKTKQHIEVETTATKHLEATIDALDLQEGDCIVSTLPEEITLETVVIVPCNEEWQYRVLNSFEIQSSNYPSDIEFEQHAYSNCDLRYTYTLVPTEEGWTSVLWPYRKVDCLQESFGLSLTDTGKLDRMVGWDSLQNGECFNEASETKDLQVELVPCDSNWQYQVLNSFTVGGGIFPSDIEFDRQAFANCDPHYTLAQFPEETWPDWRVYCFQESFGLSVADPAKLDRLVSLDSLEAGQCFNEAPETMDLQVEMVDCSESWEYQVVNIISVPTSSAYPGDSYFQDRADRDCDSLSDTYFHPTPETWEIGDHQILCTKTN